MFACAAVSTAAPARAPPSARWALRQGRARAAHPGAKCRCMGRSRKTKIAAQQTRAGPPSPAHDAGARPVGCEPKPRQAPKSMPAAASTPACLATAKQGAWRCQVGRTGWARGQGASHAKVTHKPCGLMDKTLVLGTKDCRLESCQGHARGVWGQAHEAWVQNLRGVLGNVCMCSCVDSGPGPGPTLRTLGAPPRSGACCRSWGEMSLHGAFT